MLAPLAPSAGAARRRVGTARSALEFLKVNLAVRRVLLFGGPLPDLPAACEGERYWRLASPRDTRDWVARQPVRADYGKMYDIALAEGHLLFLAEDRGIEIGYRWLGTRRAFIPWPYTCELSLGQTGYFPDIYVAPSHRGRGIGKGGVLTALRTLQRANVTRCAALVLASNRPSVATWRHLGVAERQALHVVLPRLRRFLPPQPWRHAGIVVRP
jgi:GNAT superfamily N-acetyltransferase